MTYAAQSDYYSTLTSLKSSDELYVMQVLEIVEYRSMMYVLSSTHCDGHAAINSLAFVDVICRYW